MRGYGFAVKDANRSGNLKTSSPTLAAANPPGLLSVDRVAGRVD
ncbi:MAG: hypothetical protein ACKOVA_13470 [Novosphingobium sp.]